MMAGNLRRTEAKAFFANERTFLHWMNMSVTTGSISAALLGKKSLPINTLSLCVC